MRSITNVCDKGLLLGLGPAIVECVWIVWMRLAVYQFVWSRGLLLGLGLAMLICEWIVWMQRAVCHFVFTREVTARA